MKSYQKHGFGLWCVEEKMTLSPVGLCGLLQRDFLDAPDLGYAILSSFHGKGYATEAASATLQFAANSLNINTILAFTTPDNHRSIAVLEKAGMTFKESITTESEKGKKLLFEIRFSPEKL
jgi:RimJ/RimL family protein N-acetyltransferase